MRNPENRVFLQNRIVYPLTVARKIMDFTDGNEKMQKF